MKLIAEDMDVAEIYSPPRIAVKAKEMGLKGGWSLDLTNTDVDGKRWDFSKPEMRKRAIDKINKDKPLVIIGSPACTDWSTMMNINWPRMSAEDKARRMKEARMHLRLCATVYKHQAEAGRYFVHEHPQHASSRHEPEMKQMLRRECTSLRKSTSANTAYGSKTTTDGR